MKQHFQHVECLSNTVSSCATAVEAVQQVIGKPVDFELSSCATAMETVQVVIGEPSGKLGMGNGGPILVSIPINAIGSTAIFVGDIPRTMTDDQVGVSFGIKASEIVRFHPTARKGWVCEDPNPEW